MERHEAVTLVDRMMAIWPSPEWPAEHAAEWLRFMVDLRVDVAEITIEQLKRSARRRPSFADFQDAARELQLRISPPSAEALNLALADELPPTDDGPPLEGDAAKAMIAAARAHLDAGDAHRRRHFAGNRGSRRYDAPVHVGEAIADGLDQLERQAEGPTC